jgi:hypothetical protein
MAMSAGYVSRVQLVNENEVRLGMSVEKALRQWQ